MTSYEGRRSNPNFITRKQAGSGAMEFVAIFVGGAGSLTWQAGEKPLDF